MGRYNPAERRDSHGRWTSAMRTVADRLEAIAKADGGPDRAKMPQLSGVPKPGSKADRMFPGRAPGSEVDLTGEFQNWLGKRGVKVVDTEVPSSALHPSQDELNESKVIAIAKFMQKAPKDSPVFEPIFTTADGHVIDGHHRWAANEVRNEVDGVPRWMKVRQMQAPLDQSLALASQFMDEYGLPHEGVAQSGPVVSHFANLSVYTLSGGGPVRKQLFPGGDTPSWEGLRVRQTDEGFEPERTIDLSTPIVSAQDGPRMAGVANFGGKKAAPFVKGGKRRKAVLAKAAVKGAKWSKSKDDAYDKAHGIKEGSKRDKALDKKRGVKDMSNVDLSTLTAADRKALPPSAFVFPGKRAYPIHDEAHARDALARSSGKPEAAAVRAAVRKRFPNLGK